MIFQYVTIYLNISQRRGNMPRKETHEEFYKYVQDVTKKEYILCSEYTGSRDYVHIKHTVCGTTYPVKPTNFKVGNRCAKCSLKNKPKRVTNVSTDDFKLRVSKLAGQEYTVLGEYHTARVPLAMRHELCGTVYNVRPDDFRVGKRCPICSKSRRGKNIAKKPNDFSREFYEAESEDYILLTPYYRWDVLITVKHKVCGGEYQVTPNSFLNGRRCPKCTVSRGEKDIEHVLKSNGIPYETQKEFEGLVYKRNLKYDFYIESLNTLIEYNGKQHYEPIDFFGGEHSFNIQKERDNLKIEYAKGNNIRMLVIPYTVTGKDISKVVTTFLAEDRK